MIAAVDLVVYGTVTKTGEPQHRRTSRGRDYVFRFQSVKVREVLSPRTNVKDKDSATIAIWQSGGTLVVDGREVSTAYDEMFLHPGDVVVLFLRRAADGSFSIAYGPGGLIRLDDAKGYASLPNRLRHVTDVGNRSQMSTQDLLGAIRKASRKH
jgi:hypothetical protein